MERRERIETELEAGEAASPGTPASPKPEEELAALKRKLAELRRRYSDEYPDVRRVSGEIAAMEAQMATGSMAPERDLVRPGALRQGLVAIDQELGSLRQQDAVLRGAIAEYEGRVANAPRRQFELQQLSRGYDLVKQRYETLLKQYEDAQLSAKLEQDRETEQFRVLDPAVPPVQPAAPNRLWLLIMGLVAACGLAVGAVMTAERLDSTFHTADDLRALVDAPLVAIRRIVTRAEVRQRRQRYALGMASAVVVFVIVVAGSYYVAKGNEQLVRLTARGAM
jgi:uncharacterized protein involved in exopolysaccharide biosynthesis